jgi:peptidoglycan/LPS O-acetylase OafA/YrhL
VPATVNTPPHNNIDWMRLVFATQVLVVHVYFHIQSRDLSFIGHFPGVPAFFFLSGFLIYASYVKSPSFTQYYFNRVLRLMPALIFVTIGGLAVIVVAKGMDDLRANPAFYATWFVSQITLGQAYNPDAFRSVGVGVINGALWTITVEILFYISVPIVEFLERYISHLLYILFSLSFLIYSVGPQWLSYELAGHTLFEYLELTPVVWGWMFIAGILCFKNFDQIYRFVRRFWWAGLAMAVLIAVDADGVFLNTTGNRLGLVYFATYLMFTLYLAFGLPCVRLKADLSYGVYIWHMVIINALIVIGLKSVALSLVLTFAFAAVSWIIIEKPALSLKRYSLLGR